MVAWDDTVHSLDAQKKHEELHAHTHAHTLEKNWVIEVIRWELNPVNVQSNKIIDPR